MPINRPVNWSEERKLFKAVTETTSIIAFATDPDGHCFYFSPQWNKYTGLDEGQGMGFSWFSAIHPDDIIRVRQQFFAANDSQVAFGAAHRLRDAAGDYRLVWSVALPKFSDEHVYEGFYGTICPIEDLVGPQDTPVEYINVLTSREREVLALISDGHTSEVIASMLGIAARTVDNHVSLAAEKLKTSNRVHTVASAIRLGEI